MNYISTRGLPKKVDFSGVLLSATADDGGLFMPESLPDLCDQFALWQDYSYQDICCEVVNAFVGDAILKQDLEVLIDKAYANFSHPELCQLQNYNGFSLLELFHGPTCAFKDFSLQLLGGCVEHVLEKKQEKRIFLGSTSGDTGSAAIDALKDKANIELFMLHPHKRISRVQALQMLTVSAANVHNLAIQGTFDDCQRIVKSLFGLQAWSPCPLGSVNSINLFRIFAQVPYYFYAYFRATQKQRENFTVVVPSGNFGNALAGFLAAKIGLPIRHLVVASNQNNVLTRFFQTGEYFPQGVTPTISPSMDIQVSSNLERFLWLLLGQNSQQIQQLYSEFSQQGKFFVDLPSLMPKFIQIHAGFASEFTTKKQIISHYQQSGEYLDPHTAVGIAVAKQLGLSDFVVLATAHWAKFADELSDIFGASIALPDFLEKLADLPARSLVLPSSVVEVKEYVENNSRFSS